MGVHCGISERELDECSYVFFNDCINELIIKLEYDCIINILGNSFADDTAIKYVNERNPFNTIHTKTQNNKLTMDDIKKSGLLQE
ncbi:hypothetical protein [Clostridium sp. Marseille-QA1073]